MAVASSGLNMKILQFDWLKSGWLFPVYISSIFLEVLQQQSMKSQPENVPSCIHRT